MQIISTPWHVVGAIAVFIAGLMASASLARFFSTSWKRALVLYIWHTLFCLVYLAYVMKNGGDAIAYYRLSMTGGSEFEIGTPAVGVIASFFSHYLNLSILGTFLGFNIFGYIGLLAFDASLQAVTKSKGYNVRRLATLIVFLPSVSFWSSAIGKDSLSFLAVCLCLWAVLNLRRRQALFVAGMAVMLIVRPHMAALMVIALAVSMAVEPRISPIRRWVLGAVAVAVAIWVVPLAMTYSGLGLDDEATSVSEFVKLRQGYNMDGGAGIDISSMSLPLKLFTYLFRPLPFEAHNISALAASIDNVVLLFLVILGIRDSARYRTPRGSANRVFMWVYSIAAWVSLALTTSNLGISVRQKWMFVPLLIFLFISMIGRTRKQRLSTSPANGGVDVVSSGESV